MDKTDKCAYNVGYVWYRGRRTNWVAGKTGADGDIGMRIPNAPPPHNTKEMGQEVPHPDCIPFSAHRSTPRVVARWLIADNVISTP